MILGGSVSLSFEDYSHRFFSSGSRSLLLMDLPPEQLLLSDRR